MLDSDLVLQPAALAGFAAAHARHPRQVLLGRVDWLPPLDRAKTFAAVTDGRIDQLRDCVPHVNINSEVIASGQLDDHSFGDAVTPFRSRGLSSDRSCATVFSTSILTSLCRFVRSGDHARLWLPGHGVDHASNVKRWRNGQMALRWCAAGMVRGRQAVPPRPLVAGAVHQHIRPVQ